MAIGFPAGITEQYIVNNAQEKLSQLRDALEACEDFYLWLSAYAAADLEAAPISMDSVSAQALFNAFSDANQLCQMYKGVTGFPTATLPYNFSGSQRVVIGPLS